jgi:hypothetical protein
VPTILALKGISERTTPDGRVLIEALQGGPDEEQVPVPSHIIETEAGPGSYKAALPISEVGHQRYIDKSWRMG